MASLHEIKADLEALADACDLTQHGLGKDLLDTIAVGIAERSIGEQKAPSGAAWAPNKEPYASSPRKRGKPVGVLSGEMLSLVQLEGTREIEPERARMRYGISEPARQKIGWFTAGRSGIQAPRPVYDLDDQIRADLDTAVREHIERVVAELK